MGGRVLSIGQIQGKVPLDKVWRCDLGAELDEEGDPPRIWLADAFRPGCSFSRSLGDLVAEGVGCIATPEVSCHDLTDDDVFAVVASDGVFELLTDQDVLDICARSRDSAAAAHHIAAAAYREWYEQEGRVDDISVIVLTFASADEPGGRARGTLQTLQRQQGRVRQARQGTSGQGRALRVSA